MPALLVNNVDESTAETLVREASAEAKEQAAARVREEWGATAWSSMTGL